MPPPHTDTTLPFFADHHRQLAVAASGWAAVHLRHPQAIDDLDAHCRELAGQLGAAGWLQWCVPQASQQTRSTPRLDARALCLLREIFAWHAPLADFVFAMQGLGAGALSLFGTAAQQARYLPGVASGRLLAAFALSETEAGSDVAALRCQATSMADGSWRLNGEKTWISNGGIADFYVVFARTEEHPKRGSDGISAFIIEADNPGLRIVERITTLSPHPLARIAFDDCPIAAKQLIGQAGDGFRIAMTTLDWFRVSVAAAALGMARRALHETLHHVQKRQLFGRRLADMQLTQASLAEMGTALDAAALLTYRAAWQRDQSPPGTGNHVNNAPHTGHAAMAKLFATEEAQRIVDTAVQLFGGRGVTQGEVVEALYRDIRALRIYEGASEIQKLVIARELLKSFKDQDYLP
ncbi:MAG: acyl-CoA dehydrogenase family protein [Sterolibacterium sp.]|nr:acyl-CoA dehydrogenase family protein [Sterolibacterium sp.]